MTDTIAIPLGLEVFLDAYIEAVLWSTTDNADESGGEPLDANYDVSDLSQETLARMRADCIDFLNRGGRLIVIAERLEAEGRWSLPPGTDCTVLEFAGHDLWLSRNGHWCGFWDGDWPRGLGEGLDKLAKGFCEVNLYVGDDGMVHGC